MTQRSTKHDVQDAHSRDDDVHFRRRLDGICKGIDAYERSWRSGLAMALPAGVVAAPLLMFWHDDIVLKAALAAVGGIASLLVQFYSTRIPAAKSARAGVEALRGSPGSTEEHRTRRHQLMAALHRDWHGR